MDISGFLAQLGDIPVQTEAASVKRKSRDFYWYSPVLKEMLDGKYADCVVMPRNEEDILTIARAARASSVRLTMRGGGTGNYGQAVPLEGGAIVDMTGMDQLLWVRDGVARVQAGANMLTLDRELRAQGFELRMFPSTKRTATIGGFICGGSGGVGSATWGGLRDAGNLLGARMVDLAAEPSAIELRGAETSVINHTYGTTGIVTELEIPVMQAVDWRDMALAFDSFAQAAAFGRRLALQSGIEKKLVSVMDPRLVPYFANLRDLVPQGKALVITMVAPPAAEIVRGLAMGAGGTSCFEGTMIEAENDSNCTPLYELTWNHTTLQVLKKDRAGFTYLQTGFPAVDTLDHVARISEMFGDELMQHLEFGPSGGLVTCSGLPVIAYSTPERLAEIIEKHWEIGILVANPHVYTIEDGGIHRVLSADLARDKHRHDPLGLLNPGKMRSFELKPA